MKRIAYKIAEITIIVNSLGIDNVVAYIAVLSMIV